MNGRRLQCTTKNISTIVGEAGCKVQDTGCRVQGACRLMSYKSEFRSFVSCNL
jgi:hypothetical protein